MNAKRKYKTKNNQIKQLINILNTNENKIKTTRDSKIRVTNNKI